MTSVQAILPLPMMDARVRNMPGLYVEADKAGWTVRVPRPGGAHEWFTVKEIQALLRLIGAAAVDMKAEATK